VAGLEVTRGPVSPARVRQLVDQVLAAEDASGLAISVGFASAKDMARLNRQHRGQTGPTDVLSWPFDETFPQGPGGEVVICPEAAEATARDLNKPQAETLDLLIVHGVLHLLGYEDDTAAGRARMDQRTGEVLASG
jgi:probable rRNA maturation factor